MFCFTFSFFRDYELRYIFPALAVACQESDIRNVKALIVGPPGSPYQFGFFEVCLSRLHSRKTDTLLIGYRLRQFCIKFPKGELEKVYRIAIVHLTAAHLHSKTIQQVPQTSARQLQTEDDADLIQTSMQAGRFACEYELVVGGTILRHVSDRYKSNAGRSSGKNR